MSADAGLASSPMSQPPFLSRRLTLAQIAAGITVAGRFLLPADPAQARPVGFLPPPWRSPGAAGKPLVMLDPGHGGRDPGAIGVTGTYEKHVALEAALDLRQLLIGSGRYRVAMTRATDVFIPLEQRVERAQRAGANLFVSMHADALPHNRTVRGASVYTFASRASDPEAAAIATSENAADHSVNRHYRGLPPQVARILASLMQRETRTLSGDLAGHLVGALPEATPMLTNPERHAGFVVLQSARIPSVLVEMGFMSNLADETALRQPAHRFAVARAMAAAVGAYFAASAPRMAG